MQMLFALLVSLAISASVRGQGKINFDNLGALPEHKVYIDEWLNPSALAPGGREFLVALYFARIEDGESALTQVGNAVGFFQSQPGVFAGGPRTVATTFPGQPALFQVKGWEAVYGSTYEGAAANPAARIGQSPAFLADTVDPASLEVASNLIQASSPRPFRGFVIAIPEPSTGLLALAGIVTVVLALGRKPSGR